MKMEAWAGLGAFMWHLGAKMATKFAEEVQERLWEPLAEHLGAKMAPKIAKRSPKRRKDGQLGAKMNQDGAQEVAKCSQDGHLGLILRPFGFVFHNLGCSLGVRLHIRKHQKTFSFWRFFLDVGFRMEAKSKKIWSKWPC